MNPDDVRALARGGLLTTLGLKINELSPDRVGATLPITPHLLQPFG